MALTTISGKAVHPIGIGTWNIASRIDDQLPEGGYRNVHAAPGNEVQEIDGIVHSINRGQNHLDCAELYGAFYTDEVVGKALDRQTLASREDLYIADKLWKHSVLPGATRVTVEKMLAKLGTDYLDLLYIHAPWPDVDWRTAIPQIDDLIDANVVRHFGVSNFTVEQMMEAQAISRHPITANQMEFSCIYQDEVDDEFRRFCSHNGIAIVAYRPIKRGEVLKNATVAKIAAEHSATPAQIAMAWLLRMETLPIPKAINKAHIDENLGSLNISLSDSEMEALSAEATSSL